MAGIATGAILEFELRKRVRQHFLDAVALDLAGREGLAADHHRLLAQSAASALQAMRHPMSSCTETRRAVMGDPDQITEGYATTRGRGGRFEKDVARAVDEHADAELVDRRYLDCIINALFARTRFG